jgi:hypothetical protein
VVLWLLAQAAPAQAQGDQTAPTLLGVGVLTLHAGILAAQIVYAIDGELLPPEGSGIELALGVIDVVAGVILGALVQQLELAVAFSVPLVATGGWLVGHGIAGLTRPRQPPPSSYAFSPPPPA